MKCSVYKCDSIPMNDKVHYTYLGKTYDNLQVYEIVCNFHYEHYRKVNK